MAPHVHRACLRLPVCVPHPIPIPAYPSLSHSIGPLRGVQGRGGRRPLLRLRWRVAWASVERSRKEGRKRKKGTYFEKIK